MASNADGKEYWKALHEHERVDVLREDLGNEFPRGLVGDADSTGKPASPDVKRRDFLKLCGFSLGGATIAGCTRGKEEKLIPFLIKPEEVTPGRATWYSTSCGGCPAGCGVLAKNRDGRPIKLEGHPQHPLNRGGLCATGQACLLGLYDSRRLKRPRADGADASWPEVDRLIRQELTRIRSEGGKVRFLTETLNSPTLTASIDAFLATFEDARRVEYDPVSTSALLDAHAEAYGARVLPRLHFERAKVIVSFDADFLGTWISPVEFTAGYQDGRQLEGESSTFSYHVQVESRLSLTGSNADHRLVIRPADQTLIMAHLAERLAKKAAVDSPWTALDAAPIAASELDALADRLWGAPRGETLVVCGTDDLEAQRLTIFLNNILGNDRPDGGGSVDLTRPSFQRQGSDRDLSALIEEMRSGEVTALFVDSVDPVYDLPAVAGFTEALKQVRFVVSFAERMNDTAAVARYVCPRHDAFESWRDAEPIAGVLTVGQPLIAPLGDTRSVVESLAIWQEKGADHLQIQRDVWRQKVFPRQQDENDFDAFWDRSVHDGFAVVSAGVAGELSTYRKPPLRRPTPTPSEQAMLELVLYSKVSLGDGRHAYNPWLQELPDPISKVTWDNYASLAPRTAAELGLQTGDVVRVGDGKASIDVPVLLQPGQHPSTVAVALGYGHRGSERFADIGPEWIHKRPTISTGERVGRNAAALIRLADGRRRYSASPVSIEKTSGGHSLATTQSHHSLSVPAHLAGTHEGPRPIVQETTLEAYRKDPSSGSHKHHELLSIWSEDHRYDGHHWGMAIDLSRCTGCSACVLGCQAENNIPVVGKDEVLREREMSWLRIDRYYSGDDDIEVVHQPMMCQHCDNAPCENVCPVLATVHSSEGLNQQVYNRCVGTRYCANNCPYKTRRFNWFDYPREDSVENMVLNPDVTVRSRGIMEKCSFCVQRIQEAKAEAKRTGRSLRDGDVQPACQQSCPSKAIVFGDRNDPKSEISRRMKDPRHFRVLEELNVLPSVGYLTSVKNRAPKEGDEHHG